MIRASSFLYGRLCIIIAVTILLFLPLTFSRSNNTALAQSDIDICQALNEYVGTFGAPHPLSCEIESPSSQSSHCDAASPSYSADWCIYDREVVSYNQCLAESENYGAYISSLGYDAGAFNMPQCQLPPPPAPLQTMDCNELQTCSGNQPVDWNEEAREDCKIEREIFFTIFCYGVGKRVPIAGPACDIVAYEAGEYCDIEYLLIFADMENLEPSLSDGSSGICQYRHNFNIVTTPHTALQI